MKLNPLRPFFSQTSSSVANCKGEWHSSFAFHQPSSYIFQRKRFPTPTRSERWVGGCTLSPHVTNSASACLYSFKLVQRTDMNPLRPFFSQTSSSVANCKGEWHSSFAFHQPSSYIFQRKRFPTPISAELKNSKSPYQLSSLASSRAEKLLAITCASRLAKHLAITLHNWIGYACAICVSHSPDAVCPKRGM